MTAPDPKPRLVWSRVTVKFLRIPLTASLADKSPATLEAVGVALLPQRSSPDKTTTFAPANVEAGNTPGAFVATILAAAPDADAPDAVLVPEGGADIYARNVDTPEVEAELVGHIDLLR